MDFMSFIAKQLVAEGQGVMLVAHNVENSLFVMCYSEPVELPAADSLPARSYGEWVTSLISKNSNNGEW